MEIKFLKKSESDAQRGIDEFIIDILDVKDIENCAGYLVYFKPVAGDYRDILKNVLIIDGVYQSVLSYSEATRNEKFMSLTNKGEK